MWTRSCCACSSREYVGWVGMSGRGGGREREGTVDWKGQHIVTGCRQRFQCVCVREAGVLEGKGKMRSEVGQTWPGLRTQSLGPHLWQKSELVLVTWTPSSVLLATPSPAASVGQAASAHQPTFPDTCCPREFPPHNVPTPRSTMFPLPQTLSCHPPT